MSAENLDAILDAMNVRELKDIIEKLGASFAGLAEKNDLRARARELILDSQS